MTLINQLKSAPLINPVISGPLVTQINLNKPKLLYCLVLLRFWSNAQLYTTIISVIDLILTWEFIT